MTMHGVYLRLAIPYIFIRTYGILSIYVGLARTIYIRCFWQGNHHAYGQMRCVFRVLANPTYTCAQFQP